MLLTKALESNTVVVLVIAHPDDEAIFFAPTLKRLASKKSDVRIICLSNGNADGIGHIRSQELLSSAALFHLSSEQVVIVDNVQLQDGMDKQWPEDVIANLVSNELAKLSNTGSVLVLTFDDYGVSGHPNHIAVHYGTRRAIGLLQQKGISSVQGFQLKSRPLWRKFMGILDILLSRLSQEDTVELWSPWTTIQAMLAHRSQFVWFRQIFVILSSFSFVNAFVPLKPKR